MKILNLYSGIGGNRKLWGGEHKITAVENRVDIAYIYKYYFPNDKMVIGDAHEYLLNHFKEFDFIWSSPPCQTHSRARFWAYKNNNKVHQKYPDMNLYQEILFLQHYYNGLWLVENVNPFYEPLINPTVKMGRHLFWCNFKIKRFDIKEVDIKSGSSKWKELYGFDLAKFKTESRNDQIYRNCVHPNTGLNILNCATGKTIKNKQCELF